MLRGALKQIITFLTLSVAFCFPPYYFIISATSINAIPDIVVVGIMWAPGVAALSTRLAYQENLRGFGWGLGYSGEA
jgi:uncharacterized protein